MLGENGIGVGNVYNVGGFKAWTGEAEKKSPAAISSHRPWAYLHAEKATGSPFGSSEANFEGIVDKTLVEGV
jgi:hypothetical protein